MKKNGIARKIVTIVVIVALLTSCLQTMSGGTMLVFATEMMSGACGTNAVWSLDDAGVLTVSGTGDMEDYTFEVNETLTGSTAPWMIYVTQIKEVIIQEGITSVGSYAFCGLQMNKITIANTVDTIREGAFFECESIAELTLPDALSAIGQDAFRHCNSVTMLSIPGGVSSLTIGAFAECIHLQNVEVQNGTTYIGGAFEGCSSLKTVSLPDSVLTIDSSAFKNCVALENITIPDSVTTLGWYVFQGCSGLKNVTLSSQLTTIPYLTFADCSSLNSVNLPDGVRTIGECAFQNCTALTTLDLPEELTYIREYAFYNCTSLNSMSFPANLAMIYANAFENCSALTAAILPEALTFLSTEAFKGCSAMQTLYLPKNALTGNGAFWGCSSLTNVTLEDGFTYIYPNVFRDCIKLVSIEIPSSVVEIKAQAFMGCTSLSEITIEEGLINLGDSAFQDCSSLNSITLPESMVRIGADAFTNCTNLSYVEIPANASTVGTHAFGYTYGTQYEKIDTFRLGCHAGSEGENYATVNGIAYDIVKIDIAKCTVNVSLQHYVYTGKAKTPIVSIVGLEKDTDYEVVYSDNVNAGTATITISGIGKYNGVVTKTFTIEQADLSKVYSPLSKSSYSYDGAEKCPTVTVNYSSEISLVENQDYILEYVDNLLPGTATVTMTGIGNFTGSQTSKFTIMTGTFVGIRAEHVEKTYDGSAASISVVAPEGATVTYKDTEGSYVATNPTYTNAGMYWVYYKVSQDYYTDYEYYAYISIAKKSITTMSASLSENLFSYDGTEKKPVVTLAGLKEGTDFTVMYSSYIYPGTATATIRGMGNYEGTLKINYTIKNTTLAGVSAQNIAKTYDGKTASIKVTVPEGAKITYSTDGVTYVSDNPAYSKAGSYKIYYKASKYYYNDVVGSATIVIAQKTIKSMKATLTKTSYIYSGTAKKPDVTISGLKSGVDYKVTYSNNKLPGTATVTITGTGNYTGSITKTFSILVGTPEIMVIAGSKKAVVGWNKIICDGYEIRSATTKNGTYRLVKTVSSTTKNITIKNLTKGNRYYFKVRAYQTINGKKVYGSYSSIASVKITK